MFNIANYKGQKVVMHCKTEEETKDFCNFLADNGFTWSGGQSYKTETHWNICKNQTCYNFNEGLYSNAEFYKGCDYQILEWEDFMEKKVFTKADLQDGDFIVRRNGTVQIVSIKHGAFASMRSGYDDLDDVKEDLTCVCGDDKHTIICVYRPQDAYQFSFDNYTDGNLIFDRDRDCPKVKEISLADLEKQYGCKVKIVK